MLFYTIKLYTHIIKFHTTNHVFVDSIYCMFNVVKQLLFITRKQMRQNMINDTIYSHRIEYYSSLSYELAMVHKT